MPFLLLALLFFFQKPVASEESTLCCLSVVDFVETYAVSIILIF